MFSHTPASRAWLQLCALTDRPSEELGGIAQVSSSSQFERVLAANGYALTFTLEQDAILASFRNDSVPAGRLPKLRAFAIEGDSNSPYLVESGRDPMTIQAVFDELTNLLRALSTSSAGR